MQTLIPQEVSARAHALGRLGFGLTARGLMLLLAGVLFAIPEFFHPHRLWIMLAWDALIAVLIVIDLAGSPAPGKIAVTRRFVHSPAIGQETEIELEVRQESRRIVTIEATDELHACLIAMPVALKMVAFPRDAVRASLKVMPAERGDFNLGKIFLRYRGVLGLAERWAACDCEQKIRVFPATGQAGENTALYLMRARQIELQKRRLRLRGIGREFESLRDYQRGDELRNVSWTATARRAKLITRQFTTERSQQVWVVLDAGRLSRTAFALRKPGGGAKADPPPAAKDDKVGTLAAARDNKVDTLAAAKDDKVDTLAGARDDKVDTLAAAREDKVDTLAAAREDKVDTLAAAKDDKVDAPPAAEDEGSGELSVTQLDQAATAAVMLAQVIGSSGDKFALLTYGRKVQQQLLPGNGPAHLRVMIDLLSQTKSERSEADHLNAVSRLKNLQRRRGLVLWVTEMADSVGRPEVVTAAAELVRRHLVVLVLLQHPELDALSVREPKNVEEMFASTAAQQILDRRREAIVKLRQQGVLVVETTPGDVGAAAITKYLEVKAQGSL